jgi:hypothetical protein
LEKGTGIKSGLVASSSAKMVITAL